MTKDNHTLDALKFTKKPVTIEAWQFTTDVAWNYFTNRKLPPFGCDSISGEYHTENKKIYDAYFYIKTLEGNMRVSLNDWIIKGVKGEFYPCKPDIFEATYTRPQPSGDAVEEQKWHNKYHDLCSQCWGALGITQYTGKHIAEHIEELRAAQGYIGVPEGYALIRKEPDPDWHLDALTKTYKDAWNTFRDADYSDAECHAEALLAVGNVVLKSYGVKAAPKKEGV